MKLNSLSMVCGMLLLFPTHFSLAKKSSGKSSGGSKPSSSNKGSTHSSSNAGHKNTPSSSSHDGHPKQPGGDGGYGGHGSQGGYGGYGSHGSQGGYGGYGGHGRQGGYGGYGGHGRQGGYGGYGGHGRHGGGSINYNPKNKILSPRYGGSFGHGGYNGQRGSPFSRSVGAAGSFPSDESRGFGGRAVVAAAGGAMVGMALGYGLGRFPRPQFGFRTSQEEYYYNNYMYKKYGSKSTDSNDYSRDYNYTPIPKKYVTFMDTCMRRKDLLPEENQQPNNKTVPSPKTASTVVPAAPEAGTDSNITTNNTTAKDNSSNPNPSTPLPTNTPDRYPVAPTSQILRKTTPVEDDDDDDTVSVVEIGYPALIEQLKVKQCMEMYVNYSDKYLIKGRNGVQGLMFGSRGLLAVATSAILMLAGSNMLLH